MSSAAGRERFAGMLAMLALAGISCPARASDTPAVVQSTAIDDVAVTIYRAPGRSSGGIDPDWPEGFAFISETRTIHLPAGTAAVRFEGVAEGLLPETAVIGGLPDGVIEKNRDARLLSPGGLVDSYLKRRVTLQRTDRATGKIRRQDAILQAGPNGGVLVQTAEGYEALGCSGLPERMTYGGVPKDLSAKPTLSVLVASDRARTVTVQLLYLAEGFDWSASYVADRRPDGGSLAMTGWITLANGGATGFPGAQLNVIAGRLEKQQGAGAPAGEAAPLRLSCWPMDITSTHPLWALPDVIPVRGSQDGYQRGYGDEILVMAPPRVPELSMYSPVAVSVINSEHLAKQEDLGDLKQYRLPFRTDVAAKQQKQVALLAQDRVAYDHLYTAYVGNPGRGDFRAAGVMMRMWNRKADGLGLAMPAGEVAIFDTVRGDRLLLGEVATADKAVDERIDLGIGESSGVLYRVVQTTDRDGKRRDWQVTISNDRPVEADVELEIPFALDPVPEGAEQRGRSWFWRVRVPANDRLVLAFVEKDVRD
ncbi:hypothetical protein [Sphingopyxis sp.]|uniref:DUF4139 domain-containing protein n=1 Tax=Sphingopyxis sp. TaxID=1908224 RepID=UPI002DED7DF7|nr:hypothetical protein [Sphingopyxis sp.]